MAITQVSTRQLGSSSVTKDDIDITTTGKALITKLVAGTNITLSSTGVDAGTGDVTINAAAASFDGGATANDIEITDYTKGIIQYALDGSKWRSTMTIYGGAETTQLRVGTPQSFTATPASSTSIVLAWTASPYATGYVIDRATDSGFTTNLSSGIYSGSNTTYTDTGLTASTQYYYRIKATLATVTDSLYGTTNGTTSGSSGTEILDFTVNAYATNTAGSGQINFTSTANSGTGTGNRKFTGDGYYQVKPTIGNTTYNLNATITNNANTYRVEFNAGAGTITEFYNGGGQGQQSSQATNINTNYYRFEVSGTTIKLTTSATEGGTYTTVFTWSQAGTAAVDNTFSVNGNGPGGTTNNFSSCKINGSTLSNNP